MATSKVKSLFEIDNSKDSTFANDDKLPSLPLPTLRHTLARYLDSVRPFVTAEQFEKTKRIVDEFERGVGARLNKKLSNKAATERNWVEKWWESEAYLKIRYPLVPYCSMDGVQPLDAMGLSPGPPTHQIKHASLFGYNLVKFWQLLRQEKLRPTQSADGMTNFSMSQFRRLYNTVRVPGATTDSLHCYFKTQREGPCSSLVVVLCRGRMFAMEVLDASGEPITPPVWEEHLTRIRDVCTNQAARQGVSIMSCDERTNWCQNRRHLLSISDKNRRIMDLLDRSMFLVVLDEASPNTESDVSDLNLCGDYNNRWPDKSLASIVYKNGQVGGLCDHTAFDGIASISAMYYGMVAIEEQKEWPREESVALTACTELEFDVDDAIQSEINRLQTDTLKQKNDVIMTRRVFNEFGKTEIQKLQLHPDSFVQMALQLTYQRLHGKPAPCYETATTRGYYNGRTETVRSCSVQCVDFVKAMLDKKASDEERGRLLEAAVGRHNALMAEARENAGCDRHLFGLYCTALEEGIDIPAIFTDPAYTKSGGGGNYILSTSLVGYTPIGGAVAPMCLDGYGAFYNISPKSNETSAQLYFSSLQQSLVEMRDVMRVFRAARSKL